MSLDWAKAHELLLRFVVQTDLKQLFFCSRGKTLCWECIRMYRWTHLVCTDDDIRLNCIFVTLPLFFIPLSPCHSLSHTHTHSHTVKEEIGAYAIVTPVRVNEAGDKFPTSVHFKRKRRSLDESTGNITDHWASPNIHYRISAFGQNYHLNLTLDSGFIAPLYTVTVLGVPRGDNITDFAADGEVVEEEEEVVEEDDEEDTELRHCFYKGHVNAQAEHAAVISLCSGLVSFTHGYTLPCMWWFLRQFFLLLHYCLHTVREAASELPQKSKK